MMSSGMGGAKEGWQQSLQSARRAVRAAVTRTLYGAMERLLPVRRDVWCFCTWGNYYHTLDNPRAVFESVKNDPSICKVILQRGARKAGPVEGVNVRFLDAASLAGMYWLSRSAVVLLGYRISAMCGYSSQLTRKHIIVQLWHGIPLKRIGRLYPEETGWPEEAPLYAATVSSSDADADVMARAFAPIPRDRVWVTGLPRNSTIVKREDELPPDYRSTLAELRASLEGRRLVLYAPTWRDRGLMHYAFPAEEVHAMEKLLRAHGAVLGVRGHSNVRSSEAYTRQYGSDAFMNLNDVPDANLLLRLADVLVTDYSSIYIDYLLTDRPIVHFAYDLDEYRTGRGLLYETGEAFAGPAARTFADLLAHLEHALQNPGVHADQRQRARRLFHTHAADPADAAADRIRALVNDAGRGGSQNEARIHGSAPAIVPHGA
jgi:CDP-glycerol glycerophosphotransferase (TagB/SpsB family)